MVAEICINSDDDKNANLELRETELLISNAFNQFVHVCGNVFMVSDVLQHTKIFNSLYIVPWNLTSLNKNVPLLK